jgi:hypothetical protein
MAKAVAEDDFVERYHFWIDCHDKSDTLDNCLLFLIREIQEGREP